jgi:UDP-N-acetylmuramoyl-tripeptide--D-alanyl-D-alanine ligase
MSLYPPILRPDVVVVTTIGSEHHRGLGTLDETAQEKARMLRDLSRSGIAVLNADDPRVHAMASLTAARVVTYGFAAGSDVRAVERSLDWPHGSRLAVEVGGETHVLRLRLIGRVAMYPALAALAVAWTEGYPPERATTRDAGAGDRAPAARAAAGRRLADS